MLRGILFSIIVTPLVLYGALAQGAPRTKLTDTEQMTLHSIQKDFLGSRYLRRLIVLPKLPGGIGDKVELNWWAICAEKEGLFEGTGIDALLRCSEWRLGDIGPGGGSGGSIGGGEKMDEILANMPCRENDGSIRVSQGGSSGEPGTTGPFDPNAMEAGECTTSACHEAAAEEAEQLAAEERIAAAEAPVDSEEREHHEQAALHYENAAEHARAGGRAIREGRSPEIHDKRFAAEIFSARAEQHRAEAARLRGQTRSGVAGGTSQPGPEQELLPACRTTALWKYCLQNYGTDLAACRANLEDTLSAITGGRCHIGDGPAGGKMVVCKDENPPIGGGTGERVGPWGTIEDWCEVNPVASIVQPNSANCSYGDKELPGALIDTIGIAQAIFELCNKGLPAPFCSGPNDWPGANRP